jgi:hypothetical protein
MNQNYSSKQLIRLCKPKEWEDYDLTKEELVDQIDDNFDKIINNNFDFNFEKAGEYLLTRDLAQKLILRKLNDNLKRKYKDEQSNRRVIIKQVKTLLEEEVPMWILKTDIEKFYENIDAQRLISKLHNDSLLSFHSLRLIDILFSQPLISENKGIPKGLSVSSTLSEIYMRRFDKWIKRISGIYYYARFVDDIILFSNDPRVIEYVKNNINSNLEKGLRKKENKTKIFKGEQINPTHSLEYLGYKFFTINEGKKKSLFVSIADKKVKKIKSRITLAFLDYFKNKDYQLLEKRIEFLTSNYSIRKNKSGNDLKAGIFYNYSYVSDLSVFDRLNNYYHKILNSKTGNFGYKVLSYLNENQKKRLSNYSFKHGFLKKVNNSFTPEELMDIKRCWL